MPTPPEGSATTPPPEGRKGVPRLFGRRVSVAVYVIASLVAVATLFLFGMGIFSEVQEQISEKAKLKRSAALAADQLAAGLSLPLWNFDSSQVSKILDSAMQDPDVFGLTVTQTDPANPGSLVSHSRARGESWQVVPGVPDASTQGLLVEERRIVAMGEPIGRLKVFVTPRFLDEEMGHRAVFTAVLYLVFDLLLITALYILLWRVILKPLRGIERYALEVRSGRSTPAGFTAGGFHGELESLRHSIGDMVSLLQSRLSAIREKETTLRAVLDSVPQAVYWVDEDGRLLGCNRVFAQVAGLDSPEAILGRRELDLPFRDEDLEVSRRESQEVLRTGVPKIHLVERLQKKDGTVIWLDLTKIPISDGEGRPVAVLGIFEDITEQKRAEEEHGHLQEQLNQSQKLESIGRLAGGVAHDNNNMLTAILMHAELLRDLLGPSHPALSHIHAMEGAAHRSAGLIRQLLAFSRKQVATPKIVDLNELLDGFRKSMAPLIGEDVEFTMEPAPELWKIRIDPVQVDQIVVNLVVNARDAMPGGGALCIETANVRIDADYCRENPGSVPGDYVVLTVSDTGVGMTAEIRRKIFEPFFTTKEVGKGTGLGLSTVFGIVKQNNGFLNVYSEPGLGATFRIYLPRCLDQVAEIARTETTSGQVRAKGRILVVEDDQSLRDVIPRILERLGYEFLLAEDPEAALRICRDPDTRINLMLTDVVMPGMSGKELWEQVSRFRKDLKVVYMSGYTAEVISRQGVLDGGTHFIQKPFSTAELGRKLQAVLEES